jgi:hypothetical protein
VIPVTRDRWVFVAMVAAVAACSSDSTAPLAAVCQSTVAALAPAVGTPLFIDPLTQSSCVEIAASNSSDSASYLIIAQSAGGDPGDSAPFSLQTGGLAALAAQGATGRVSQAAAVPHSMWARLRQRGAVPNTFARGLHERRVAVSQRIRAGLAPRIQPAAPAMVTKPTLGSQRTFAVCADYFCATFKSVTATVQSVGAHVVVYVDNAAPANGLTATQVDSLRGVFDKLYAIDTTTFGGISDIDTNGVVLTLMTGVVNSLVSAAQCQTGGYVAGFFLPDDLDTTAAHTNKGEIFYTVVADPSGTLSCAHAVSDLADVLPTTFLHELEHVIIFNQHVLVRGGPQEDLWLDEALASYAEEVGGRSFLPDSSTFFNYVIGDLFNSYIYLLNPQDHFLLQQSDTVLEDFGAGWLYIRYLMDQFGPSLAAKLTQTTLTGTTNVATHTGVPFATTSGRWSMANWVSDLPGFSAPAILRYTSWSFRNVYAQFNGFDPTDFPRAFPLVPTPFVAGGVAAGFAARAQRAGLALSDYLRAGSGAYTLATQHPGSGGFSILFNGQSGALSPALIPQLDIVRLH